MRLHHISLTKGYTAVHRLDVLDRERVGAYRRLATSGEPIPGLDEFTVKIRRDMITILRGNCPVILCALGSGRSHAWNVLEAFQETFGRVRARPPAAQWLGVVELPSLGNLLRRDARLMADFQRYLAAAILLPSGTESQVQQPIRGKAAFEGTDAGEPVP